MVATKCWVKEEIHILYWQFTSVRYETKTLVIRISRAKNLICLYTNDDSIDGSMG